MPIHLSSIDSLLTWVERIERHSWGRRVIAVIAGAAWWAWAWLYTTVHPAFIVAVAICLVAALLYLQERLYRVLVLRLGPPIKVEITAVVFSGGHVSFPIHVLNTSADRRVSLSFVFHAFFNGPIGRGFRNFATAVEMPKGFDANLAAQAETSGEVVVKFLASDYSKTHRHDFYLLVTDHLTGRKATLTVPGSFPPGYSRFPVEPFIRRRT